MDGCMCVCMYVLFFFILGVVAEGDWYNMSCVFRLFGLCMYALRGTGGLEAGFVRRAWFLWLGF